MNATQEKQLQELLQNLYQSEQYKQVLSFVSDNVGNNIDNPSIMRSIDNLGLDCAWIYDRLRGKTMNDKGTLTKKMRKLLGYY